MCAEDAPNGKIIQAGNGRFSAAAVFSNDGVNQGANASYESFLDDQEIIMDLSTAEEGWAFRRKQKSPLKRDALASGRPQNMRRQSAADQLAALRPLNLQS